MRIFHFCSSSLPSLSEIVRRKSSLLPFLAYVPAAPAARSAPPGACVPLCCFRPVVCFSFLFVGAGVIDLGDLRSR